MSYKFLNIVAAVPGGDHANPQATEWLRQHASPLALPLQAGWVTENA